MDKSKYRKENGNFIRRVGPLELENYILHTIDKDGKMQRIIHPPNDVIEVLVDEKETNQGNPKVEFVYSIKKLARKHGKSGKSSKKPNGKFGLHDFVQLFADAEKPPPQKSFPTVNPIPADLQLPKALKEGLHKTMDNLLEKEAHKRWEELSQDLCPCKKKKILEQIRQEHELAEMQRMFLKALIAGYNSYGDMLLEQLDRNGLVLALNLNGGVWSLEKRDARMAGAKLVSRKNDYWRQHI